MNEFFNISNKKSFLLLIMHVLGGGTERHIQELKSSSIKQNYGVIIFRQYPNRTLLEVWESESNHYDFEFSNEIDKEYIKSFLALFNIVVVHVHQLIGYNPSIISIITSLRVTLVITLHDYYFLCPRVHLTLKSTHEYCGEQGLKYCNTCMKNNYNNTWGIKTIEMWHEYWLEFLKKADLIIAPSNDTKNRFQKYYPELNIKVIYHPEIFSDLAKNNVAETKKILNTPIKIGLLGNLVKVKGMKIFYECIEDLENRDIPAKYILFGQTKREQSVVKKSYKILGSYDEKDIYELISKESIDIFVFFAQCPETYSYVLTIPMLLKYPIIATNLGSFNERLADYPLGKLIDWKLNPKDINDTILEHVEYCGNIARDFSIPVITAFPNLEEYYGIKLVNNKTVKYYWADIELLLKKIEQMNIYYYSHPTTSIGMRIYSKSLRKEKKYLLGLYWKIRYLFKKYFFE